MSLLEKLQHWAHDSIVDEIIIFAIIVAIVETTAQNVLKNSEHYSLYFFFGLSIYMIVAYILHFSYHHFPMSKLNITWSCLSIVFAITIGGLIYQEPISTNTLISGAFAIAAIIIGSI